MARVILFYIKNIWKDKSRTICTLITNNFLKVSVKYMDISVKETLYFSATPSPRKWTTYNWLSQLIDK